MRSLHRMQKPSVPLRGVAVTTPRDVIFLPGEKPEPTTFLQQRLEGQQIVRFEYGSEPAPHGGAWVGIETADGWRLFIMASRSTMGVIFAPDIKQFVAYTARLLLRLIPPQKIWTKRMHRHARYGRVVDPTAPAADAIQQRVEGQIIKSCVPVHAMNASGGEQLCIGLGDGRELWLGALPTAKPPYTADLEYEVKEPPPKSMLILP